MRKKILVLGVALALIASVAYADPLSCSLTGYKSAPGLTAAAANDVLTLLWEGAPGQDLRLGLTINNGVPTIQDLAVRRKGGQWSSLASNVTPEFRVVSGKRRITNQQLGPMKELGIATPERIEIEKWNAFWDAPLDVPGIGEKQQARNPDMPRKPEEIKRATATYQTTGCEVKTNGGRLEVTFPGTTLGVFSGRLQYTVYKGSNLLRLEVIAKTDEPSVAYKYDAGLKGVTLREGSRVVWRDTSGAWQDNRFGGSVNAAPLTVKASNRLLIAEGNGGSIAVFPPPHIFFWTREEETNLGYLWYRKDTDKTFSFGIRQAEREENPQYQANFALYSAPPGTWQRMPVYFYVSAEPAEATTRGALAYTRDDRFKALPGYQVMGHHYHMRFGQRLERSGSTDTKLHDLEALKSAGINIVSLSDNHGDGNSWDPGALRLKSQSINFEGIRKHSDKNFLIMPNEEVDCLGAGSTCPQDSYLGAHWDLLFSKPTFWTRRRAPGQPLVEQDPTYGKVYHIGSPQDAMEMITRENALVFMPHPRTKGSTGYPDAIKDKAHFQDARYRGVGWRWGMGHDLSEQRMCDVRCLNLLDDMNNWVADLPTPPKYILALTETYQREPGDDTYANNPVGYLKIDAVPTPNDMTPVIEALKRGDYFVTSGEVLIPSYSVEGTGPQRTVVADVEWTFPLEFVEVVWGDGQKTDRQIIPATDLPAFGKKKFQIPFNATGKKWVRFAVWDSAGNGALVQPIKLSGGTTTAAAGAR